MGDFWDGMLVGSIIGAAVFLFVASLNAYWGRRR